MKRLSSSRKLTGESITGNTKLDDSIKTLEQLKEIAEPLIDKLIKATATFQSMYLLINTSNYSFLFVF